MITDFLTLTDVKITRKTVTPDGLGGVTTVSVITTLPRAIIWGGGQSQRYMSDKMYRASTHVMVTVPGDYSFTDQDAEVTYGGKTYRITGPSDDVLEYGEIMVTGLERLS